MDTPPEIRRRQLDVYRAMTPAERVEVSLALSEELRRVAVEGIRARHPAFDDADVHREWLRMVHGPRLAGLLAGARRPR